MYSYEPSKRRPLASSGASSACALVAPAASLGKEFCLATSMHGFRHVAEPRRHWMERLLWVAATALAIWGAIHVSLGQLQRYNENPTVVTLEKDFRSWQFSLPAVTVCHMNRTDPSKLEEVIFDTWNVGPSDERYGYYVRFVRTVSDSSLVNLRSFEEFTADPNLDVDLFQLAVDVMPELEIKCTIENKNVIMKWIPVMTEFGGCYSVNSLSVEDTAVVKFHPNETSLYPITCKYGGTSSCHILLDVNGNFYFHYHSPFDVVDITTPRTELTPGNLITIELTVTETMCGRGVKDLSSARRGCLFNDEPLGRTKVYSTNACRQSCRSKLALELCKCIPFYYFYDAGPQCDPAGMACLAQYAQNLTSIGGHKCSCPTQCLYSVFRDLGKHDQVFWDKGPWSTQGSIKYVVQPPKIRYTREIVFHFQDLVVSFGGAAGLFLGASFISFVEIIYFLLERLLRAVSIQDTPPATREVAKKKPTYEEQRVLELTAMMENEHQHYTRNMLYF